MNLKKMFKGRTEVNSLPGTLEEHVPLPIEVVPPPNSVSKVFLTQSEQNTPADLMVRPIPRGPAIDPLLGMHQRPVTTVNVRDRIQQSLTPRYSPQDAPYGELLKMIDNQGRQIAALSNELNELTRRLITRNAI